MERNVTYGSKNTFIAEYLRERLSVRELCELYGISRKSGYKWIDRYLREGPSGLSVPVNHAVPPIKLLSTLRPRFFRHANAIPLGRYARMHRTLKAETTRTLAANSRAQQRKFNHFRDDFNYQRPHEALDMQTPASRYEPSRREMPNKLPPLEYPDRFDIRYVSYNGGIGWNHQWVNVSIACAGEYVGLEEIDDGV